MIMSVSTLIIFSGIATPSSLVNLSIERSSAGRCHGRSGAAGQESKLNAPPPSINQIDVFRILITREQEGGRIVRQRRAGDMSGDQLAPRARRHHAEARIAARH